MKKNILLLLMPFLCFFASYAQAQECDANCCSYEEGYYVKVLGGANFLEHRELGSIKSTSKTGYIISGSIGYYLPYGFRVEGEYAFRRNAIHEVDFFRYGYEDDSASLYGHSKRSSYMANILWDAPLSFTELWNIRPFVGVGMGYDLERAYCPHASFDMRERDNHFAWQMMTGLTYPIFHHTDLSLEYNIHLGTKGRFAHSLGLGLLHKFG